MLLDQIDQCRPTLRAKRLCDDIAGFQQQQCRYTAYAEAPGERRILINIDLGEFDAPLIHRRQLIEPWRELLAGSAPRRPEIDEYGQSGLLDFVRKSSFRNINSVLAH
jgi:hypothetical protein